MWRHGVYLAALMIGLLGLLCLDWRLKLAWFADWRRCAKVLAVAVAFFALWDAAGIIAGIFIEGSNRYRTGLMAAPHLPIEEPIFLLLLSYSALVVWRLTERRQ